MIKSYFKILFRNFVSNKSYSVINIAGLAVGITCTLLILNWVKYEMSFDNYHKYNDRIYRFQREPFCTLAPSFVPLMQKDFPDIEKIARVAKASGLVLRYKEKKHVEEKIFYSEPEIFDILSIYMINGNPKTALADINTIVLSESAVKKYFGNINPIGKEIELVNGSVMLTVTGVIKDIPVNSHIHFDFLISFLTLKNWDNEYYFGGKNFSDNVCLTYARLAKGTDPHSFEAKFPKFIDRYLGSFKDDRGKEHYASEYALIKLMKVSDIHLNSHQSNEVETNSDIKYVGIFSLAAFFILLIACINFVNLTVAKSLKRAKEVAIRKISGSKKSLIAGEMFFESLFYIIISLFVAVVLYETISPYFTGIWNGWKTNGLFSDNINFFILSSILILTTILSGVYPSILISKFKTVEALKNSKMSVSGNHNDRNYLGKILIVLQFSISIGIIICIGIIYKQLNYIQNRELGFNKENVVLLHGDSEIINNWMNFKTEMLRNTGILNVTKAIRGPSDRLLDNAGFEMVVNGKLLNNSIQLPHNRVEQDFFKTYGIQIVAGRDFDINNPTDAHNSAILNETAVKKLGFKSNEEIIGKTIKIKGVEGEDNKIIIGICQDFHYESMHHEISAIVTYVYRWSNSVAVRIESGNPQNKLNSINKVWSKYHNDSSFEYSFLDEKVKFQYLNEQRMLQLFNYFGLLAIFITCLGLYGLTIYTTERRIKEIGIRKSNGAKISDILLLLSIDFLKWVLLSYVIICPIAFLIMDKWLQNFAYRTSISWWIFAIAGLIAIIVALATVLWQSWKAANRNPVESLRYE